MKQTTSSYKGDDWDHTYCAERITQHGISVCALEPGMNSYTYIQNLLKKILFGLTWN